MTHISLPLSDSLSGRMHPACCPFVPWCWLSDSTWWQAALL